MGGLGQGLGRDGVVTAIVSRWSRADSVPCPATWWAVSFIRASGFMPISRVVVMTRGSTGAV